MSSTKFTVLSSKESTSIPGNFRTKCSMKSSNLPSFVKGLTVYITTTEGQEEGFTFEVPTSQVQVEQFPYTIPEGENKGTEITLNRVTFS